MTESVKRALVIGAGSWGTALALCLARNEIETTLWCSKPERADELRSQAENKKYLPGIALPKNITFSADPHSAAEGAELVVSVVPTQYLRETVARFEDALHGAMPMVSATKGLEIETFRSPSEILCEVLGERVVCVLTGPTHAEEVAQGLPASVVAASPDAEYARLVQQAFSSKVFRVYTHSDARGAELAGALKNVIAIAAGICDGLGLGDNAKAALITRGMVEMARFGRASGARGETFFGLAGVGDLIATCCSRHSRNRAVGEAIGSGKTLEQVLGEMKMVAEGVWTTKALFGPEASLRGIQLPIAEQVHAILFEGQDPRSAVFELMRREPTDEMQGLFA